MIFFSCLTLKFSVFQCHFFVKALDELLSAFYLKSFIQYSQFILQVKIEGCWPNLSIRLKSSGYMLRGDLLPVEGQKLLIRKKPFKIWDRVLFLILEDIALHVGLLTMPNVHHGWLSRVWGNKRHVTGDPLAFLYLLWCIYLVSRLDILAEKIFSDIPHFDLAVVRTTD